MKLIVGIDFGTSTTVVRYKIEGSDSINAVKDADGASDIIPSVIFQPSMPEASTLYGKIGLNRASGGEDGELIRDFKMGLVSSDPVILEKTKNRIREFMKYVFECFYNQTSGIRVSDYEVNISYPAKWPSSLCSFMKEVVREAGFKGTIRGVVEPIAAVRNALKSRMEKLLDEGLLIPNKPLNVLMLDMGAGTSDIYIFQALLEICDGEFNIICQSGTSYPSIDDTAFCGGMEVDNDLRDMVHDYLKATLSIDDEWINQIFTIEDAKKWKDENVSPYLKDSGSLGLPNKVLASVGPLSMFLGKDKVDSIKNFKINRSLFESKTLSHWSDLYNMIQSAMKLHEKRYNISASDIDLILLTGGHSAWYTVPMLFNGEGISGYIGKDYVHEGETVEATHFTKIEKEPWRIISDPLPHESVAKGLLLSSEKFEIPATASNNVWIRLKMKGQTSNFVKVVNIGDRLPVSIEEGVLSITSDKRIVNHIYDILIEVKTGKTLKTAKLWSTKCHFDDRAAAILTNFFLAGIPILVGGMKYIFKLRYSLKLDEDGVLHFDSYLKKNNEKEEIHLSF